MLTPFRRHSTKCPHRDKGRAWTKCRCPIHVDGTLNGKRYRDSLNTRDWARALRRIVELEAEISQPKPPPAKTLSEAVQAFLDSLVDHAHGTVRNNRRILRHLESLAEGKGITLLQDVDLEFLDGYRRSRPIQASTWVKELEILRHFLNFCMERDWIERNPAQKIRPPKVKPKAREPYTQDEFKQVLAAADRLGQYPYERQRAKAMILLLYHTGLRVSDIATLRRDRLLDDGRLHVHTLKTGQPVLLPLPLWWTAWDSNPRPPHCERGALPAELAAHSGLQTQYSTKAFF
jgi:integrase/recombinase XerD